VVHDKKVPVEEKVLSLSDADAGFIFKGQRDPMIGYKSQVAQRKRATAAARAGLPVRTSCCRYSIDLSG